MADADVPAAKYHKLLKAYAEVGISFLLLLVELE
jgi:hypothetical protein